MHSPLLYRDTTGPPTVEIHDEPQAIPDESANKTPPTALPLEEQRKLKATPRNRGTASASEHLHSVRLDDVRLPVFEDLKDAQSVGFDKMLLALLSLSRKDASSGTTLEPSEITLEPFLQAVLPFCDALDKSAIDQPVDGEDDIQNFRKYLKTYCDAKNERQRYEPLTLALNHALHWLETHCKIEDDPLVPLAKSNHLMFHVNDPKPINGQHFRGDFDQIDPSIRKPDIILTDLDAVRRLIKRQVSWSDYALGPRGDSSAPTAAQMLIENNFSWGEPAISAEIKFRHPIKSSQSDEYDIVIPPVEKIPLKVVKWLEDPVPLFAGPSDASHMENSRLPSQDMPLSSLAPRHDPIGSDQRSNAGAHAVRPSADVVTSRSRSTTSRQVSKASTQPAEDISSGVSTSRKRPSTECAGPASSKRHKGGENSSPTDQPRSLTPPVQTAMYAAERLSHAEWISHAINFLIIDEVVYVWWYDRQGIFQSGGLDLIRYLPHFLVLLLALQRMHGSKSLGVIEEVYTKDRVREQVELPLISFPATDGNNLELRMGDYVRTYYGIIGRGTWVRKAQSLSVDPRNPLDDLKGKDLVVKFSWPERRRTPEADIIKKAEKIQSDYVRNHIPKLVYSVDIDTVLAPFRRSIGFSDETCDRVLRVSVFEMLEPLTSLVGDKFWKAFWDSFRCHLYLWKSGIEHRDISASNLMYDPTEDKGVLIDFDLARVRERDSPTGLERTGTIPFMALDLLCSEGAQGHIEHLYRHDCESFAWVLLWICCRYEDGVQLERGRRPFNAFEVPDYSGCRVAKLSARNLSKVVGTKSFALEYVDAARLLVTKWKSEYHSREKRKEDADELEIRLRYQEFATANPGHTEEADNFFVQLSSDMLDAVRATTTPRLMQVLEDFNTANSLSAQ